MSNNKQLLILIIDAQTHTHTQGLLVQPLIRNKGRKRPGARKLFNMSSRAIKPPSLDGDTRVCLEADKAAVPMRKEEEERREEGPGSTRLETQPRGLQSQRASRLKPANTPSHAPRLHAGRRRSCCLVQDQL